MAQPPDDEPPRSGQRFARAVERRLDTIAARWPGYYRRNRPRRLYEQVVIAVVALVVAIMSLVAGDIGRGIFLLLAGGGILLWSLKEIPGARRDAGE